MEVLRKIIGILAIAIFVSASSGQSAYSPNSLGGDGLVPAVVVPADRIISKGNRIIENRVPPPPRMAPEETSVQPQAITDQPLPDFVEPTEAKPQASTSPQVAIEFDAPSPVAIPDPMTENCPLCSGTGNCSRLNRECPMCSGSGNCSAGNGEEKNVSISRDGWTCTTSVRRGYFGGRIPALMTFGRKSCGGQSGCNACQGCSSNSPSNLCQSSNDNNGGCSCDDGSSSGCGCGGSDCQSSSSVRPSFRSFFDRDFFNGRSLNSGLFADWFRDRVSGGVAEGCGGNSPAGDCSCGSNGGNSGWPSRRRGSDCSCQNMGECSGGGDCLSQSQSQSQSASTPSDDVVQEKSSAQFSWRPPWLN